MPKTQRSAPRRDAEAIEQIREGLWPSDDPEPAVDSRHVGPDPGYCDVTQAGHVEQAGTLIRRRDSRSLRQTGRHLQEGPVHADDGRGRIIEIQRRREFDPAKLFCADCPLCSVLKESGVIVFDDSMFEAEETSPEKEKRQ